VIGEEVLDSVLLVIRDRVDVTEAASRRERDFVGVTDRVDNSALRFINSTARVNFGCPNVGDVRTTVRPGRTEDGAVRAQASICAVIAWGASYAAISGCVKDRDTLETELQEFIALSFLIVSRQVSLLATIRNRDHIGRLVNATLELASIAVREIVRIDGIKNWIVSSFSERRVSAVRLLQLS
jgi:hypothetical protein